MGKGLIIYSDRMGNTERAARGIHKWFGEKADLYSVGDAPPPEGYEWLLMGFWVDKGRHISKLWNTWNLWNPIGFFGTLGAYHDVPSCRRIEYNQ